MSRHAGALAALLVLGIGQPAVAQESSPPQRIDLLVTQAVEEEDEESSAVPCVQDDYATFVSGEIVVCARRGENTDGVWDKGEWERRHAAETMNQGNPQAPEAFGIPNHGTVVARGCFIGPCPPPLAIMIAIEALPEAPPGSDADRIARGLAPLGSGGDAGRRPASPVREGELGLPPPPDFDEEAVSPAESEGPAAER
ncbi:hypothetical protein [Qipengyuania sp. SM2507]